MSINLRIDEGLLEEAKRLGEHKTKRATVEEALKEYIQRRKRLDILDGFGSFDFDEQYDYKKERQSP